MSTPLLNCFIFACKSMVCCSVFVAFYSHHWTRYGDGERYVGLWHSCRNYGHTCDELVDIRAIWIYGLLMSLNLLFEVLNGVLLLWRRKRVRINLILEELGLIATLLFIIPTAIFCIWGYIDAHSNPRASLDWSFYAFFLSLGLAIVEFICSLVRVITYCRQNSFRSGVIRYTTNNNHETVHIQT